MEIGTRRFSYGVGCSGGPPKGNTEPVGRARVAQLNSNQFLVVGYSCRVDFRPAGTEAQRKAQQIVNGTGNRPQLRSTANGTSPVPARRGGNLREWRIQLHSQRRPDRLWTQPEFRTQCAPRFSGDLLRLHKAIPLLPTWPDFAAILIASAPHSYVISQQLERHKFRSVATATRSPADWESPAPPGCRWCVALGAMAITRPLRAVPTLNIRERLLLSQLRRGVRFVPGHNDHHGQLSRQSTRSAVLHLAGRRASARI